MNTYPTQGLTGLTPENLTWLSGNWKGHRGQDQIEEQWSGLAGGTLMAMFRWLQGEQIWFYEFITIEQADQHVLLRIKHFYPGLQGWEEKDKATEFLLVQLQNREAVFFQINKPGPWMVYRLEAEDRLVTYFTEGNEPVKPEEIFTFWRQKS
jgi:hypothetical protein